MLKMKGKVFSTVFSVAAGIMLAAIATTAQAQSLDELHKAALKEGGTVNFYGTLAQINAEKILPVFEKRFPGIKVNHVDATADKLAARAITEARGGRVLADVFQMALENVLQVADQKLLVDRLPPEAAAYPANLKGTNWLAADLVIIIGAWNTNLVKKEDEPKVFDDFADPKWKGKLIAEPRDVELLIGLARHKFKNDEKAFDYLRKLAANDIEFHKGHSELAEFLVAGQAAACVTCYAHHYPPRIKKGAPLGYMRTEGIATITADAIAKDAPHPNSAWLFYRWSASEEGQKAYAAGGRLPPHPKVEPVEKIRPETLYPIGTEEQKQWPKYEKVWKEVFKLR
ncbi:MAG TPA: extracellular solute-binding protein [Candidatus Binatia bacterium]|jgi:iron(III) transport system substrate-binding protein|nr:extracellular solute-binding protein [Candidatus Binatia bacterium]